MVLLCWGLPDRVYLQMEDKSTHCFGPVLIQSHHSELVKLKRAGWQCRVKFSIAPTSWGKKNNNQKPYYLWRSWQKEHLKGKFNSTAACKKPLMSLRSFGRGLRDRVQEILNRGTQTTRVLLCCYSSANFFLKSHSIHSSLILHNTKVFIQQNRVLKEPLMLTKSREILKSHLFRNHMRKVIGGDSSMSEFSERWLHSCGLWEGGW